MKMSAGWIDREVENSATRTLIGQIPDKNARAIAERAGTIFSMKCPGSTFARRAQVSPLSTLLKSDPSSVPAYRTVES